MAGTKGIIEIIVVIFAIYVAWTYRDRIMSFLKSHGLSLPSGGGESADSMLLKSYGERLQTVDKMNQKELQALGMDMYQSYTKSAMGRAYYGKISV